MTLVDFPNVGGRRYARFHLVAVGLAGLGVAMELIGMELIGSTHPKVHWLTLAMWSLALVVNLLVWIRGRRSGIVLTDGELVSRSVSGTRRLSWVDVGRFELFTFSHRSLMLRAVRTDGQRVPLQLYRRRSDREAALSVYRRLTAELPHGPS